MRRREYGQRCGRPRGGRDRVRAAALAGRGGSGGQRRGTVGVSPAAEMAGGDWMANWWLRRLGQHARDGATVAIPPGGATAMRATGRARWGGPTPRGKAGGAEAAGGGG